MMPVPAVYRCAAWFTRHWQSMPGRWRVVRWLESRADQLAVLRPQTVRFVGGRRMRIDPVDENGRRVFVEGYDPRERLTRWFIALVRPNDCVLDVGANVGYYTMVASHLVGPIGHVHAFEPSPLILPWLLSSVRLSGTAAGNVTVHGVAVSDTQGPVTFHTARPSKRGFSSLRDLGQETSACSEVECITLDSLRETLPRVRLIKIDVEGAELHVLRGAQRLIARDRPYLVLEVDDGFLRQMGGSAETLVAWLSAARYTLHGIGPAGTLIPLDGPPADRANVLATPA